MWEEGVIEWYQSMIYPSDWMGYVLVIHAYELHVCLLHLLHLLDNWLGL